MRYDFIQRAILGEPFHRGLGTDLIHARHVVHSIANQRQIVDDACRRYPKFRQDAGLVKLFVAHGIDELNLRVNQLRHVFVAGGNHGTHVVFCSFMCQRADYVIRFDAVDHQ